MLHSKRDCYEASREHASKTRAEGDRLLVLDPMSHSEVGREKLPLPHRYEGIDDVCWKSLDSCLYLFSSSRQVKEEEGL